ncbi:hydantoin utilization protein A [Kouleothrix aurantiaca]|uniref:Hydantoin utilization protein A n=1 Tax=Kouleothrix aurantiaca TaxID=186479 RepID=A0A0P9H6G9_9CHLR|nr:hydantoin utilization protein A [Kouleothrix aurantiaca]
MTDTLAAPHVKLIEVGRSLLESNDVAAALNRQRFAEAQTLSINLIAGPGAGKTSLIIRLIEALRERARVAVIEGDIAGSIDTSKVLAAGAVDAVQINTGGNCHLEAGMIRSALDDLDLARAELVVVENVGNLVCPTHWALGEHLKLCLLSAAEGHDKPVKYPEIFAVSDVIVLNKIDLIELVDFERQFFYETVRALNPSAPIFEVSCRSRQGIGDLADWLLARRDEL